MGTKPRSKWLKNRLAGVLGAAAVGFLAGQTIPQNGAVAADNKPAPPPPTVSPVSEASQRVVAHINGGRVLITREDLGEYLITRFGVEKIELLVNKFIIDTACKEKGIEVTPAEIEAALQDDLRGINVNKQQFVDNVLKQYGKTLFEWREDVIKPRLQLSKLCKLDIKVTEEDLKQAFESEFGPRVEGRIIIWPKGQEKIAWQMYDKIRSSEEEFESAARTQAMGTLAATGGRIKPFGKGTGTNAKLEAEALKMKPGEVSTMIETEQGVVCFKLDRQIPRDEKESLDKHRERLSVLVYDKKLSMEIPKQFKTLRDAAKPVVLLPRKETREDVDRNTETLLQTGATQPKK